MNSVSASSFSASSPVLTSNTNVFDGIFTDANSTNQLLDEILKLLLSIDAQKLVSKKGFFKSYGNSWEKLTTDQKNKTKSFWVKEVTAVDKAAIVNMATSTARQEAEASTARSANINKHDRARIIHMRADSRLYTKFTSAFASMSRLQLDARKSDRPEDQDAWADLAEAFNDYEEYNYKNACVEYDEMTYAVRLVNGTYVAVPGMENIAAKCWDLDPSDATRPARDGGCIRQLFKELRSKITMVRENYKKSGNQEAENIYDEWVNFSSPMGNDVVTYSRAVLGNELLDNLGKALPDQNQLDTGAVLSADDRSELNRKRATDRKQQRENKKAKNKAAREARGDVVELDDDEPMGSPTLFSSISSMDSTMKSGFDRSNQIQALDLLHRLGNEEDKKNALDKIRSLTGI